MRFAFTPAALVLAGLSPGLAIAQGVLPAPTVKVMSHVTNARPAGSPAGSSSAAARAVVGVISGIENATNAANAGTVLYTCNANIDAAVPGTCNFLNTTIAGLYNSAFSNVNASIYIQYGSTGLGESDHTIFFTSYSTYLTQLTSHSSGNTVDAAALASLPNTEPTIFNGGQVAGTAALFNALGFSATTGLNTSLHTCTLGNPGCYNGIITLATPGTLPGGQSYYYRSLSAGAQGLQQYDIFTVVEHETDEILGTASCIDTTGGALSNGCGTNVVSAADLFRYLAPSTRVVQSTTPGAYFSYNAGANPVEVYNTLANGDDYADWVTNCKHVQDATGCLGRSFDITNDGGVEVSVLDAIGFNVNSTAPTALSVTPASGSGTGPQTFTYIFSDSNGVTDINYTDTMFSATGSGVSSYYVYYVRASNQLYLLNDAGGALIGPATPGANTLLSNSQCTLNVVNSSVNSSGNNMIENLNVTFLPGFAGAKSNFGYVQDNAGQNSGFVSLGTWTVPGGGSPPSAVSVNPNTGNGSIGTAQTFTYTFSDPNGYADISYTDIMLSGTGGGVNSCYVYYARPSNQLYLLSDDGSKLLGPVTPGANTPLSNSQCTLNTLNSSVSPSGNDLTETLSLSFMAAFSGFKYNYGYVQNNSGQNSGFANLGSWNISAGPPTVTSVTPNSGTGSGPVVFAYTYVDPNGYSDISYVYSMLSATGNGVGSCFVAYFPKTNALYLLNDAGSTFLGPITPGANTNLSNSQCTLLAAASGGSGTGNNLTVSVELSFQTRLCRTVKTNLRICGQHRKPKRSGFPSQRYLEPVTRLYRRAPDARERRRTSSRLRTFRSSATCRWCLPPYC